MPRRGHQGPDPFARGLMVADLFRDRVPITTALIRERFGVSAATAKRDMLALEVTLRPDVQVMGNRQIVLSKGGAA